MAQYQNTTKIYHPVGSIDQLAANYAKGEGIAPNNLRALTYAVQFVMSQLGHIPPRDMSPGGSHRERIGEITTNPEWAKGFLDTEVQEEYLRIIDWSNPEVVKELLPDIIAVGLFSSKYDGKMPFRDLATEEQAAYVLSRMERGLVREKTKVRPVVNNLNRRGLLNLVQ